MNYKSQIEKVAQARWRKYIDSLQTEDELMDFASQASRNKRQMMNRPGNFSDRREIGFNKDEMKRVLSSPRGWAYEDNYNIVPTTQSLRGASTDYLSNVEDVMLDAESIKRIQNRKASAQMRKAFKKLDEISGREMGGYSTSMNAPGSLEGVGPDDLVPIIHGGNRAKAEAFVRGGNGFTELQTRELLDDGKLTKTGLQFHSKVKNRAPGYASMSANNAGGSPAVIEAKIPRKYLYPNTSQGPHSDEFGLPDAYFNKMQDIKVYNPETGKVYMEMKDNKNALPYGRTRAPGAPNALERATKSNANRKDFTMGAGELTPQTQSKEAFKEAIRKKSMVPQNQALVPVGNKGFEMVGEGTLSTPSKPVRTPKAPVKPSTPLLLEAPKEMPKQAPKTPIKPMATVSPEEIANIPKLRQGLSRNAKIGLGLGAGALALGAGAYGFSKLKKKKKEEIEKKAMEV